MTSGPIAGNPPRAFFRAGIEEEEITPPCKQRSFDSLSVAHILQAKLDPEAAAPPPIAASTVASLSDEEKKSTGSPSSPGSPSIDAAAEMLTRVHSHAGMDTAADLLLSMATLSGSAAGGAESSAAAAGTSTSKRHVRVPDDDGLAATQAARRRLKMQKPNASSPGAGPSSAGPSGAAARAPSASKRPRGSAHSLAAQQAAAAHRLQQHAAAAAAAHQQQQQLYYSTTNTAFTVSGVGYPIKLLSGASLQQLKLLSAAFQLCPSPTNEQIHAIARRVALSPEKLDTWFQSRRTLHEWVTQQPHLQPADLAGMFYSDGDEAGAAMAVAPAEVASNPPPPQASSASATQYG